MVRAERSKSTLGLIIDEDWFLWGQRLLLQSVVVESICWQNSTWARYLQRVNFTKVWSDIWGLTDRPIQAAYWLPWVHQPLRLHYLQEKWWVFEGHVHIAPNSLGCGCSGHQTIATKHLGVYKRNWRLQWWIVSYSGYFCSSLVSELFLQGFCAWVMDFPKEIKDCSTLTTNYSKQAW